MDTPFITEQIYDAPIAKVWQAMTGEDQLRQWYFPQLKQFEPTVGFEFSFSDDGSPYQKKWTVSKVTDGRLLAHRWAYKGYPGSSEVTFELFPIGDRTKVRVTHTGLASFPDDPHF